MLFDCSLTISFNIWLIVLLTFSIEVIYMMANIINNKNEREKICTIFGSLLQNVQQYVV